MDILFAVKEQQALWDNYVSSHECGHFMQSYAWGELRQIQGWTVDRLMALENGVPLAAMMIQSKWIPFLKKRIAYCPRGPVFNADRTDALALLSEAAWALPGLIMLRCDPYFTNNSDYSTEISHAGWTPTAREWSHWNNARNVMWLDISCSLDALMRQMGGSRRSEMRKPEKYGVVFEIGDERDMGSFHALMLETAQNKNIAVHDGGYYALLYETLKPYDMIALFMARYENNDIATGMSVKYGSKAWLMYAASAKEHFKLGANRTLQMRMIEWAINAECTRYDLRGSATHFPPRKSDPGYGVYEFKKSFGAELVSLSNYYNYSPTFFSRLLPPLIDEVAVPAMYRISKLRSKNFSLGGSGDNA